MPVVGRIGPYHIYFLSGDRYEPPHVHVWRDGASVKFWLNPVAPQGNRGFGEVELRRVRRIVEQHKEAFLRRWHDHFDRHDN